MQQSPQDNTKNTNKKFCRKATHATIRYKKKKKKKKKTTGCQVN
jgi:hypothetical protein